MTAIDVPRKTPPGGWRAFYVALPKYHPAGDIAWRRWSKQDPQDQAAWIAETSASPVRGSCLEVRDEYSHAAATLGLAGDFGPEEIARVWRQKSKAAHPDAGGSTDEFRRITEARDRLLGSTL